MRPTYCPRHDLHRTVDRLDDLLRSHGVRMETEPMPEGDYVLDYGWNCMMVASGVFIWEHESDKHEPHMGWIVDTVINEALNSDYVRRTCDPEFAYLADEAEEKAAELRRCLGEELWLLALDMVEGLRFRIGVDGHKGEQR